MTSPVMAYDSRSIGVLALLVAMGASDAEALAAMKRGEGDLIPGTAAGVLAKARSLLTAVREQPAS